MRMVDQALMPRLLLLMVVSLAALVHVEPAPLDILIALVAGLLLVQPSLRISRVALIPLGLLVIYVLLNFLSLVSAFDIHAGMFHAALSVYVLVLVAVIIFLSQLDPELDYYQVFNVYLLVAILSVVLSVLDMSGILPGLDMMIYRRAAAFFKDPNVFASFLVPAVLYALYRLFHAMRSGILLWLIVCFILSVGLTLAASRASWLGLICGTLTMVGMQNGITRTRISWHAILLLLLIVGALLLIILQFPVLFSIVGERLEIKDYDSHRFHYQWQALLTVLEYPLGIGSGQFEGKFNYATHNTYLRLLSELGLAGFAVYLCLLLLSLANGVRAALSGCASDTSSQLLIVTSAIIVGLSVNALFIDTLHWRHFWVLLALHWALLARLSHDEGRVDHCLL